MAKDEPGQDLAAFAARLTALEKENADLKAKVGGLKAKALSEGQVRRAKIEALPYPERAIEAAGIKKPYCVGEAADVALAARHPEAAAKMGAVVASIYRDPVDGKKKFIFTCDAKALDSLRSLEVMK